MKRHNSFMYRINSVVALGILALFLCFLFSYAEAATVYFKAETGEPLVLADPPVTNGPTEFLQSPGNAHAVNHGNRVKREGVQACVGCHNGENAVVAFDKFICSQYDFGDKGLKVPDNQGGFVKDPMSGDEIVSGDGIAVLLKGIQITCKMCHFPHDTPGFKAEDYLVHQGCLECHAKVGSGDLKEGGGDDQPIPSEDPPLLKPMSDLCNDCHKAKRWKDEGHKKHAEKKVACIKCHSFD